jgi:alpha-galactosidase
MTILVERMRERQPDLVIENCASDGHCLAPSMLARTAMSSFSDAHEVVEIPIIAANLHRLMLLRQLQIWAVLKTSASARRLVYSLAATFLGRMCLSGDVDRLSVAQWDMLRRAEALYGQVAPIIKHGKSRHFGELSQSWRHPHDWQAVVRTAADGARVLVVLHAFANAPAHVAIPLPEGEWEIKEQESRYGQYIRGAWPHWSHSRNHD